MRPRPGGGYLGRLPTAGVKLWYRVEPYAKVSFRFGVVLWVAGGGGGDDLLPVCYKNHSTNLLCLETELAATDKWRGEMVLVYRACGGDED
jgi:hypothetical protein